MKVSEVIKAIDGWLREYNSKNPKKPEPESVATIRACADKLRKVR